MTVSYGSSVRISRTASAMASASPGGISEPVSPSITSFGKAPTVVATTGAPDAIASGADTLVSIGGVQSNHTRMVAAVAAKIGMKCRLVQESADLFSRWTGGDEFAAAELGRDHRRGKPRLAGGQRMQGRDALDGAHRRLVELA